MSALRYRPDWRKARETLTTWWHGGGIGRPALAITVPRHKPRERIPEVPAPEGCTARNYTTKSMEYRINYALRSCIWTDYLGEAVPRIASGDVGPNSLALYLGCQGEEGPETVWFKPFLHHPERDSFDYHPDNCYWNFTREALRGVKPLAEGKFLQEFPDFIEGLDTLAAMRGTERLLTDLISRPAWVHASLRKITDLYFRYYDAVYDLIRDEVGGSVFWAWGPGRTAKFQCDFSAMISPAMFKEFMVPVLREMTERVSYSIYHWDGPGAILHLDAFLAIPRLHVIQWTPGAGAEPTWHERWWPFYHRIFDAGKKLMLLDSPDAGPLLRLKKEFAKRCQSMYLATEAKTRKAAEEMLGMMEV